MRNLDNARELSLLVGLGQWIALVGAGEATLRAERKLLQWCIPAGFVDPALEIVRRLELRRLARHQSQHRDLAPCQQTQRRKRSCPQGIIFEEVAVDVDLVE